MATVTVIASCSNRSGMLVVITSEAVLESTMPNSAEKTHRIGMNNRYTLAPGTVRNLARRKL